MGIKNLFKRKCDNQMSEGISYTQDTYPYPVPYSVVKIDVRPNFPKIEYREAIIDKKNINLYRTGQMPFLGGFITQDLEKGIVVYRYKIDKDLILNPNESFDSHFLRQLIEVDKEEKIIAHEMKHWNNLKLGSREQILRNFEELALSYAWDEISAFTSLHLYNIPLSEENVLKALSQATHDFVIRARYYMNMHTKLITNIAFQRSLHGQIQEEDLHSLKDKHSESFQKLISGYLTFGDICCWKINSNSYYANDIRQNVQTLKAKYQLEVKSLLDSIFNISRKQY